MILVVGHIYMILLVVGEDWILLIGLTYMILPPPPPQPLPPPPAPYSYLFLLSEKPQDESFLCNTVHLIKWQGIHWSGSPTHLLLEMAFMAVGEPDF